MSNTNPPLKKIYLDIINGFSPATINGEKLFIKHFHVSDQADLDIYYEDSVGEIQKKGVPSEKQMLERLKRMDLWSEGNEAEIKNWKADISRYAASRDKEKYPSKRKHWQNLINGLEEKLKNSVALRDKLLSNTAEKVASSRLNDYFIIKSFYKDRELTNQYFDEIDFNNFDENDLAGFISCYNKSTEGLNTVNIQKICLQQFFQNNFYLTESIYEFWGKRLIDLTIYQSELSAYGRYYKSILQNSELKIPDEIRHDPEKLVEFMKINDVERGNMQNGNGGGKDNHNVGFTGTKEDADAMGVKIENPYAVWARKKKEKGMNPSLTKDELYKIDRGIKLFED